MAWAMEHAVENGVGCGTTTADLVAPVTEGPPPPPPEGPPRYRIQTSAPDNWFPFVPVAVDPPRPDIRLDRGVLLRSAAEPSPPGPAGRILRAGRLEGDPYRLPEAVARAGVRVVRAVRRARLKDGSTHEWITRRTTLGTSEQRCGLLFDVLEPPA